MDIKVKIQIQLPTIPRHIIISNEAKVHISKLSESELREIGKAWTEELVRIAKDRQSMR